MMKTRYSILYSSKTGNTKMLADAISEVLPKELCDVFGKCGEKEPASELLFVGFWTDKGNADEASQKLLRALRKKKIFLFGTAGFGGSDSYFRTILECVTKSVDKSNTVVGSFMCQGKMPSSVRERYVKMKGMGNPLTDLDAMIENYDRALSHPDAQDLDKLKKAVLAC